MCVHYMSRVREMGRVAPTLSRYSVNLHLFKQVKARERVDKCRQKIRLLMVCHVYSYLAAFEVLCMHKILCFEKNINSTNGGLSFTFNQMVLHIYIPSCMYTFMYVYTHNHYPLWRRNVKHIWSNHWSRTKKIMFFYLLFISNLFYLNFFLTFSINL